MVQSGSSNGAKRGQRGLLSRSGIAIGLISLGASLTSAAPLPRTSQNCYTYVNSLASKGTTVPGVVVDIIGQEQPFTRPAPRTLDPSLTSDFASSFNTLQPFNPSNGYLFNSTNALFVAGISNAMISGEKGIVYRPAVGGQCGVVFSEKYQVPEGTKRISVDDSPRALSSCEKIEEAVTLIQQYSWMYYHFVEEALPRLALALPYLGPKTKILTWGKKWELDWFKLMNISQDRIVTFDPEKSYCISRLLYPTPTPSVQPPREVLQVLRKALGAEPPLPVEQRNLIIVVSRSDQETRRLSNENEMVAAIKARFPNEQVVVSRQGNTPPGRATLELFKRAKAIIGPHGAGLSNAAFAGPGTTLIEVLFLHNPPLMFWTTAAALGQNYWLVPASNSYWLDPILTVPIQDVLDILRLSLEGGGSAIQAPCQPGYANAGGSCSLCKVGTYTTFGDEASCIPCAPGRYAPVAGSSSCRTCPEGTYSDLTRCLACPDGTTSWAGAEGASQCQTSKQRRNLMAETLPLEKVLAKLSPSLEREYRRRSLIVGAAAACSLNTSALQEAYVDAYVDMECNGGTGTVSGGGAPGTTSGVTQGVPDPSATPATPAVPPVTASDGPDVAQSPPTDNNNFILVPPASVLTAPPPSGVIVVDLIPPPAAFDVMSPPPPPSAPIDPLPLPPGGTNITISVPPVAAPPPPSPAHSSSAAARVAVGAVLGALVAMVALL